MTSKKVKPLASLFQQWSSQQQRESSSAQENVPQSSYRILIQSTHGLATRIQAAEAVENPQVYQRAGVPTPAETAIRDSQGGYAWLEHLVELAQKHNHLIWVATKSQPSPITNKLISLSNDENANVTVVNVAVDPWGWDDEFKKGSPSLHNLHQLYDQLSNVMQQQESSAVLAWESLTPLIAVHGFEMARQFLTSFESCMQIWPIRIELLTPFQHSTLEDDAQALLHLKGGEMTMIRQGLRERGNILRKMLPFRLDGGKLVELEAGDSSPEPDEEVMDKTSAAEKTSSSSAPVPVADTSSRKIQLKMEEDDEPKKEESSQPNRPRIYLQDDDPEFDDMDEEDPDDDLDI
ncbi:unnamed protein product [Cylindrotheca closterium]|uniref:Elongator complex protein 5 n=1 Tax=Cylindrotheca closterium TaxID=2856 RepID=A0AAD2FC56_9STRA|nr:unnamed protein product [Cylindrotheca closterium]